jgi:hypothetical protein
LFPLLQALIDQAQETSMRRSRVVLLLALLALGFAPFMPLAVRPAGAEPTCFPETKRCMEGAFRDFWQSHGALEILGLPISQSFVDSRGLIVQYYERAILEWHPKNAPEFQVLLTRLGDERLGQRPERTGAPQQPCAAPGCALLAQTQHTLRGAFLAYWQANGDLPVFGFPLTEEFTEKNPSDGKPYLVQYFERNRFEFHPENQGRYQVLLGLLGAEAFKTQPALATKPAVPVPDYTRVVGLPVRMEIPSINVSARVEQVGVDATNTMETPTDPFDVGWYKLGARPGQPGNAVVAGHVDYANIGPTVFWDVRLLKPGAEIVVTDDAGLRWRFVVQTVESYPVEQFPGVRVFGPTDQANLNLISCVGDFDRATASYNQRVVIYSRWDGVVPQKPKP